MGLQYVHSLQVKDKIIKKEIGVSGFHVVINILEYEPKPS
jgi:hypothetical protein